jgi:hypothetical protein
VNKNEEFKAGIEAAMKAVNGMGHGSEAIARAINEVLENQHRTIQQVFLGGLKLAIHQYAGASCDQRNVAAVMWAQEVAKLENSDLGFPLI